MHDVDLSSAARLIGDPSRARMLSALLDGRALTVGELARIAGIGAPAASVHLRRLADAGFVEVLARGRHRYHRLAGADVARALEALAAVSDAVPVRSLRASAAARALRPARLCYDHLAGQLGVRIHDHLLATGAVEVDEAGLRLTAAGAGTLGSMGVDVDRATHERRPLLRPCLDWTERRDHLAGSLATAIADALLEQRLLRRRRPGERGLDVTPDGEQRLLVLFGFQVEGSEETSRAS